MKVSTYRHRGFNDHGEVNFSRVTGWKSDYSVTYEWQKANVDNLFELFGCLREKTKKVVTGVGQERGFSLRTALPFFRHRNISKHYFPRLLTHLYHLRHQPSDLFRSMNWPSRVASESTSKWRICHTPWLKQPQCPSSLLDFVHTITLWHTTSHAL